MRAFSCAAPCAAHTRRALERISRPPQTSPPRAILVERHFVELWECIRDRVPGGFLLDEDVLVGLYAGIVVERSGRDFDERAVGRRIGHRRTTADAEAASISRRRLQNR